MDVRYGIIGCGNISRFHFNGLEKADARIVHVADVDPAKADARAKQFNAKASTDYRAVINDPDVTAVAILGPGRFHKTMCLEAITAGKDIICEKTLANDPAEAAEIARAVQSAGTLFFTAYMKRFYPASQKAAAMIGSLGTLFSAHIRSYQCWGDLFSVANGAGHQWILDGYGGAILKCAGSHMLDMMMFLLGRPTSVYASIDYMPESKIDRRATALFEYPGSLAVTFETVGHPLQRIGYERNSWDERVEINGVNGRLELYTTLWDQADKNAALLVHYDNATQTSTEYRLDRVNPFDIELAHFHGSLTRREQGTPSVIDGFNVDAVIGAIEQAHRARAAVTIDWQGL
jgi:predicted dehydrogenase